jgi:hypothetical protein
MMMLMMCVRHVPVRVPQAAMLVRMGVRLTLRILGTMLVLMMRVVHMRVRVREHLMLVFVLVGFGQVQPHAKRHQGAGNT